MTRGLVGSVGFDGKYKEILRSPKLISTLGMKVEGNKIYVANGDLGYSSKSSEKTKNKIAELVIINLDSKTIDKIYHLHELTPGKNVANDLVFDDESNIYVTNTFAPVIYKVNAKGQEEVFVKSDLFNSGEFNLNGIVYHPKGYLIVGTYSAGEFFKIDIKSRKITKITVDLQELDKQPLQALDGLVLHDGILYAVSNANKVYAFKISSDGESMALLHEDKKNYVWPTTAVYAEGEIYVVNSRFDELPDEKSKAKVTQKKTNPIFTIQRYSK